MALLRRRSKTLNYDWDTLIPSGVYYKAYYGAAAGHKAAS